MSHIIQMEAETAECVFSDRKLLDQDKDAALCRGCCSGVKSCAAWLKLLRAHFLQQTSDERFRTRQACRSVSSRGLFFAVRLSKAPGDPAARRGEHLLPGAAPKGGRAAHWPFICRARCYMFRSTAAYMVLPSFADRQK